MSFDGPDSNQKRLRNGFVITIINFELKQVIENCDTGNLSIKQNHLL
jgi:hypothetical protein